MSKESQYVLDKKFKNALFVQGKFINMRQYNNMSEEWKEERRREELLLVRLSSTGNAICKCVEPDIADWVAYRLKLASQLERENRQLKSGVKMNEEK